jgi:hypothetical protein
LIQHEGAIMARRLTQHVLECETDTFRGSGGISQENGCLGFQPAFMNKRTCAVYPSLFADGRPAPFHLLDGLPDEAVAKRNAAGHPVVLKKTVISGFVRDGRFYTREEAAAWTSKLH